MINSGGESSKDDLHQAVRTAVIYKRVGGMGLISGCKAFQKPMQDGVALTQRCSTTAQGNELAFLQERQGRIYQAKFRSSPSSI